MTHYMNLTMRLDLETFDDLALLCDVERSNRSEVVRRLIMHAARDARNGRSAERLREALPDLRLLTHCGGGGFKSQFKKADRSGARLALVLGEDELARQVAAIKPLRDGGEQREVAFEQLPATLRELLADS